MKDLEAREEIYELKKKVGTLEDQMNHPYYRGSKLFTEARSDTNGFNTSILELEYTLNALLDYLGLEVKDEPAKKVLVKKEGKHD